MVPLSSLRIPRVRRYFGSCRLASCFTYEALTLSCRASHPVRLQYAITYAVLNPGCISTSGLASSAFARHYSQNLVWFLFLRVLRCFSSPGSPHNTMDSCYVLWLFIIGVSPFGNLRIEAYLQLPAAYRSLSRPSSAPDAKAFALCSCSLELSAKFPLLFSRSLELLEFHKTNNFFYVSVINSSVKRFYPFFRLNFLPPFGEIVILPKLERP